jgi:hypothetical protein
MFLREDFSQKADSDMHASIKAKQPVDLDEILMLVIC